MEFDWHGILLQAVCVAQAVVAELIGTGDLNDGGREAGEGLGEKRRDVWTRCGACFVCLCSDWSSN